MEKIIVAKIFEKTFDTIGGIFSDYYEYKTRIAELQVEEHRINLQAEIIEQTLHNELIQNLKKLELIEYHLVNSHEKFILTFEEKKRIKQQALSMMSKLTEKLTQPETDASDIKVLSKTLNIFGNLIIELELQTSKDYRHLLLQSTKTLSFNMAKMLNNTNAKLLAEPGE